MANIKHTLSPLEYYSHIYKRYNEIIDLLGKDEFKLYTGVALDIDETILCDLSELPPEFTSFHNAQNESNRSFYRPKIPYAHWFINSIKRLGYTIYFVTGREMWRKERTLVDLQDFYYHKLIMKQPHENVVEFKKGVREKYSLIGIGDQPHDIDDPRFLIENFYYS